MSHQFGLDDLAWIALGVLIVGLAPNVPDAWRYLVARFVNARTVNHSQEATPRTGDTGEVDERNHYVENDARDTGINQIPAVSDTGIGVDTAWLANNLTEAQRLEVLALARTPKGKWVYSGKKLYTLFGGNYNEFVSIMRQLRNGQPDEMPEEPTVYTPFAGRPTKASYYNDPNLEYQAPPT